MLQNNWWLGIAGILCLTAGCGAELTSKPDSTAPVAPNQPDSSQPAFFPNPLVTESVPVQASAVPNLIPLTNSTERVPKIDSGRSDPFASLGMTPTIVKVRPVVAAVPTVVNLAPVAQIPAAPAPLPKPSVFPLPPLLPAPLTLPLAAGNLPSVSVPGLSPIPPVRSAAETLEISGVVQVGGKTHVIIRAGNEYTSRYAAVGERVSNGKVLIKRVEMGLEPVVILEQAGREIVRSVGSGALVGAL